MAGIVITYKNLQKAKVDKLEIYKTSGAGSRYFNFMIKCAGYTVRRESVRAGYIRQGHCISFRYEGRLGTGFAYCEPYDETHVKIYYLTRRMGNDRIRTIKKDDSERKCGRKGSDSADPACSFA